MIIYSNIGSSILNTNNKKTIITAVTFKLLLKTLCMILESDFILLVLANGEKKQNGH